MSENLSTEPSEEATKPAVSSASSAATTSAMASPPTTTVELWKVFRLWRAIINLLQHKQHVPDAPKPVHVKEGLVYVSCDALDAYLEQHEQGDGSGKRKLLNDGETSSQLYQAAIDQGLLVESSLDQPATPVNGFKLSASGTSTSATRLLGLVIQNASDIVAAQTRKGHDRYCFECHLPSISNYRLLHCDGCWRAFHEDCLGDATKESTNITPKDDDDDDVVGQGGGGGETSQNGLANGHSDSAEGSLVCPVCVTMRQHQQLLIANQSIAKEDLNQMLSNIYARFKTRSKSITKSLKLLEATKTIETQTIIDSLYKVATTIDEDLNDTTNEGKHHHASSLQPAELTSYLALTFLAYQPMALDDIEAKLEACQYQFVGEFLADCLAIECTMECVVIADLEHQTQRRRVREVLGRMLNDVRSELREMLGCVDCYYNSNKSDTDKLWFCRPCSRPHLLVFARQRGFPFWPAKVIKPRHVSSIDQCGERGFDVRFFGGHHEHCRVDATNLKDINSSLAEVGITKPNPALERALAELRNYRDLLEKGKLSTPPMKPRQVNRINRVNSIDSQGTATDAEEEVNGDGEKVATKRPKNGRKNKLPNKKRFKPSQQSDGEQENDSSETNDFLANEDSQMTNVTEESNIDTDKEAVGPDGEEGNNVSEPFHKRIPKRKIIYSPQSNKYRPEPEIKKEASPAPPPRHRTPIKSEPLESTKRTTKKKRGRKPKDSPSTKPLAASNEQQPSTLARSRREHRRSSLNTNTYIVSMPTAAAAAATTPAASSSSSRGKTSAIISPPSAKSAEKVSPLADKICGVGRKYYKKKLNLEKEKQEILSRRRLQAKEDRLKYEPPVTATKSTPSINAQNRNMLRSIPRSSTYLPINGQASSSKNLKSEHSNNENRSQTTIKGQNGEEGDEIGKAQVNNDDDEDLDDDDDCYSDQELEEHINSYIEYQKEKALNDREYEIEQYRRQAHQRLSTGAGYVVPIVQTGQVNAPRQFVPNGLGPSGQHPPQPYAHVGGYHNNGGHHFEMNAMQHQRNALVSPTPSTSANDGPLGLPANVPIKSYIEYDSSKVYVPTKKNQLLVNAYLHHSEHNSLPGAQGDYLAQMFINNTATIDREPSPPPVRRRGRPAKHDESSDEVNRAKGILEKNFLRDTNCGKDCFLMNLKAFKKFREYLEQQSKLEKEKMSKELEEVKRELYTTKTRYRMLEQEFQKEKEYSKHCNPQVIRKLEEKHRKDISLIKRKQWCILCESEAHFFCCNTSYCSPECQTKHWLSGHKYKCKRKEVVQNGTGGGGGIPTTRKQD